MRTQYLILSFVILFFVLLLPGGSAARSSAPLTPAASPLGTAFTYQGFLRSPAGSPVTGICDFQFSLYDDASSGSQIGSTQTLSSVNLLDGRFTVQLDFGGQFTGEGRWLQVALRCPAGSGGYTVLAPRQSITPSPYALALPGVRTVPTLDTVNIIAGSTSNGVSSNGATISGGGNAAAPNIVYSDYGTVSGGANNTAGSNIFTQNNAYDTIGGGKNNLAYGYGATVAGGADNTASGSYSTVAGGVSNTASENYAAICGGLDNTASDWYSAVLGGYLNVANGSYGTVIGGSSNTASGNTAATVIGGWDNDAGGSFSVAGGLRAKALYDGDFVWADSSDVDFASTAPNQFFVRASGGVYFYASPNGDNGGHCILPANGTGWSCSSDVNLKENFTPVDAQVILDRLEKISITRWNVKGQDASVQHIGPAAQDFYAAFGLGDDERLISSTDAQGVAFAAIQGLYRLSQQQQAEIESQQAEIKALKSQQASLEERLAKLESSQGQSASASSPRSAAGLPVWVIAAGALLGETAFWQARRSLGRSQK
jgi:hypothetical protein